MKRLVPLMLLAACASQDERDIESVLDDQALAWNRGDLVAFMEGYWKSEDLVFKSGAQEHRGWQATFDRYRTTYDTPEKMGVLTFTDLDLRPISHTSYEVRGRWHLSRQPKDAGGSFILYFQKFPEGWRIVRDETISDP